MYGLAGILYFKKISVMGCDFIDTIIEIPIIHLWLQSDMSRLFKATSQVKCYNDFKGCISDSRPKH